MAYEDLDVSVPDGSTHDGEETLTHLKNNIEALRDAAVSGSLPGWNWSYSGTMPEFDYELYSKGAVRIKVTLTWGTSGGEDGNVTQEVYEISYNSGGVYEDMGALNTLTITYDSNGYATSETWS